MADLAERVDVVEEATHLRLGVFVEHDVTMPATAEHAHVTALKHALSELQICPRDGPFAQFRVFAVAQFQAAKEGR